MEVTKVQKNNASVIKEVSEDSAMTNLEANSIKASLNEI